MECERKCVWKLWIQLHCIPALCSKVCDPSCHNNESQVTVYIRIYDVHVKCMMYVHAWLMVVIVYLNVLPLSFLLILLLSILFSPSLFLFSLPLLFSPPPSLPSSFLSSHLPPVMYFVVSFTALLEHTSGRLLPLSQLSLSV